MLLCNNIKAWGRANLPFPVRLKPQKWLYLANTFLAPPPRGVVALVSVSDDKIQITILILRRGALSTLLLLQTCCMLKVSKLINAQAQKFYNKQLPLRSLKCRINKTQGRNFLEKFDQLDLQLSLIDTTMPIFNWKLFPSIVCLFPFNFLLLLLDLDSWDYDFVMSWHLFLAFRMGC